MDPQLSSNPPLSAATLLQAAFGGPEDSPWEDARRTAARDEIARRLDEADRLQRHLTRFIEEQRRAEEALAERAQRYRDLFHRLPEPALVFEFNGSSEPRLAEANPAACHLLGCEPADLRGADLTDLVVDEDARLVPALLTRLVGGEVVPVETRLLRRDGGEVLVEMVARRTELGPRHGLLLTLRSRREAPAPAEAERSLLRRLDLALQAGGFGTFVLCQETGQATWDERAWRMFGLVPRAGAPAPDEIEPRLIPEDLPNWRAAFGGAGQLRTFWSFQVRVRTAPVELRTILVRAIPQIDAAGASGGLAGLFEDVTERLAAETKHRNALEVYTTVFKTVGEGLTLQAADDRIVDCNQAAEKILGLTRDQLLGLDSFDPRWRALNARGEPMPASEHPSVIAARTNRSVRNVEMSICRADGSLVHLVVNSEPIHDAAGQITHVITSFNDVTSRRRAEEERRRSDQRLRAAVAASRMATWRTNLQTGETEVDERKFDALGLPYNLAELRAATVEEDRTEVEAIWRSLRHGRIQFEHTARIRGRDGIVRHVRTVGMVQPDAQGRPEWVTGILEDVTERVEADQRRRELEVQLLQSQRLETLGTLAGGIAHDFNNLLTGLIGFVELSLDGIDVHHASYDTLMEARQCGLRARDLIKRLLLFARRSPDSVRMPVKFDELVTDSRRLLTATLPTSIQIDFKLPASLPPVDADPSQLQQVLMNLCVNASQAIGMKQGRISIALDTTTIGFHDRLGCAPGSYVCLTITDNGCGMDEATVARIFDPFFTTKPLGEGSGLGLAMVHGIVHSHGGGIRVHSEPGVGTRFEIFLPVSESTGVERSANAGRAAAIAGNARCVLVVDDEESVRMVTTAVLERAGFSVQSCGDGNEAIARFRVQADQFALAIVDLSMPGRTGHDLIHELEAIRPGFPIVLMSGDLDRYGTPEAGLPAVVARLAKPFSGEELLEAVSRQLAPRS